MTGITSAGLSDIGRKREDNEDAFGAFVPQDPEMLDRRGRLFVVADGMGGEAAGEIASRTAVEVTLRSYFEDPFVAPADALTRGIQRANAAIYEEAKANPDRKGMGTTCTLIALRGGDAFIAHVGDSRAYLIRGDRIFRLTRDHSLRERGPAFAHILTRAVGVRPTVEVDVLRTPIAINARDPCDLLGGDPDPARIPVRIVAPVDVLAAREEPARGGAEAAAQVHHGHAGVGEGVLEPIHPLSRPRRRRQRRAQQLVIHGVLVRHQEHE